jgi:hypothetical protein
MRRVKNVRKAVWFRKELYFEVRIKRNFMAGFQSTLSAVIGITVQKEKPKSRFHYPV